MEQNVSKDVVLINKGTEVLHSLWICREFCQPHVVMCMNFLQGGSELMDIKFEEVTVVKEEEEEEDPLSVTSRALEPEREVSCLSVSTVT